jgi:hypothetical protein
MPLTEHDAEETMRPLLGRVYDAREKYSLNPNQANAESVIHRQQDALAQAQDLIRQAIHFPAVTDSNSTLLDEE